jgi:hypothetical protein
LSDDFFKCKFSLEFGGIRNQVWTIPLARYITLIFHPDVLLIEHMPWSQNLMVFIIIDPVEINILGYPL